MNENEDDRGNASFVKYVCVRPEHTFGQRLDNCMSRNLMDF
jgi:hypothetical protein